MPPVLQLEIRCLFQQPCTTVPQTIGGSESFLLLFFSLFPHLPRNVCVCLCLCLCCEIESYKTLFKKRLYKKMEPQEKYPDSNTVMYPSKPTAWGVDVWMRLYQILTDHWKCSFSKCLTEVGAGESVKRERERESASELKHVPRDQTRY